MTGPLCFVLMPFGQKPDAGGSLNAATSIDLTSDRLNTPPHRIADVSAPGCLPDYSRACFRR